MDAQRPWHRLFGLTWMDFFRGQPVTVEPEKDLSVKKQLIDVVLIRKLPGVITCRLPDGFENLAAFNLVTFKSHQEKMSAWTLEELLGHYVNLRKQVSPSMDEAELLPRDDFRLYAVCARFPRNLADDGVELVAVGEGVYEVPVLTRRIRVVVVNQLPREEHNALLHMFSASGELFAYGARHYRIKSAETSTLLAQLFQRYHLEVQTMPDALEEFTRETIDQMLRELPIQKRLEGVPVEKLLEQVPVEKLLEQVPVEKRLEGLRFNDLLAALASLPPETREALARSFKPNGSSPKAD